MFPWATPLQMSGSASSGVHQYWRVYCTNNNGGSAVNIAQVIFLDAYGVQVATSGGTVIKSSETVTNEAYYVFDGTPLANSWLASTAANEWVGYNFPSQVAIAGVTIWGPNSGIITRCPKDMLLQYSDDGAAWTTLFAFHFYGPVFNTGRTFPLATPSPGYHYQWRLDCADNNGGASYIIVDNIEFRATAGGADQTAGMSSASYGGNSSGRVTYSSDMPGGEAYNAFGGAGPWWESNGTTNQWDGAIFPTPVRVQEVAVLSASGQANRAPQNMSLSYSDDGVTWVKKTTFAAQTGWAAGGETRILSAPDGDFFTVTTGTTGSAPNRVYGWEISSGAGTITPTTSTIYSGAAVTDLKWAEGGGVAQYMLVIAGAANSGWTTLTIGSTVLTRASAIYASLGGYGVWIWTTSDTYATQAFGVAGSSVLVSMV